MVPILETERLRLRPRAMDDLAENLAMDLDPAVNQYIFDEQPDRQAHRAEVAWRIETGWPETGWPETGWPEAGGLWAITWRDQPGFLGWSGLYPVEEGDGLEFAYRLVRRAWGKGIATESGRAIISHVTEWVFRERIVAFTHPNNVASRNVLLKLGFQFTGAVHYRRHEALGFQLPR